jgi:hypothetical protein
VRHPNRLPVLLLLGVGLLLLVLSAAAIYAGLALAERIHELLPPITADADAIGGAAVALGIGFLLAGLLHLGMGVVLARGRSVGNELSLVSGIALCAVMATLAIGWAVAALVSAASGSAPAEGMLPAGIGLLGLACLYAWALAVLLRGRRRHRGRT